MFADFRFAFRQLLKHRAFTAVGVVTLALGIGVNTTMFSVLNALVLRGTPVPDSGRLVSVFRSAPQSQSWPQSPANFYDYQKAQTSFERLAAYAWTSSNMAEPGQPAERLAAISVSGEFFPLLGVAPSLGRVLGPDDDKPGAGRVIVLSDRFWHSRFAGDANVIGRVVRLDGQPATIVGVMPAALEDPLFWGHVDLWKPLALDASSKTVRNNNWMMAVGRLKPGAALGSAQAEATAIAAALAHDFPANNAQTSLRLELWNKTRTSDISRNLSWLCMGLAGFVLLIACTNLANLQLARMTQRVREHAVRIALGATRFQVMRQIVVESVLLSAVGGLLGILIAHWGTHIISRSIYITGVAGFDLPIDTGVLLFTLLASVATGVAVGLIPAWISSRTDVNAALKQGSRGSSGDRSRHLFRKVLIVSEVALALVLLTGAGYFVRGMQRVSMRDTGWQPEGLVTANLTLPFNANYQTDAQCRAFFDKLEGKIAELPGTSHATLSASLPITGFWRSSTFTVEGRPPPPQGKEPLAYYNSVTPGHFATLGIRMISGRDFAGSDRGDSRSVAVINEAMALKLWPGESPLGKRFGDADPAHPTWLEVVGVVNDVRATTELVEKADTPYQVYLPLNQTPNEFVHWLSLAIRSSAPGQTVAASLRAAVQQLDPDQPVYAIVTARESIEQITKAFTLVSQILAAFAVIGLVLSGIGIYGVIANLVAQRTPEIGIRMALGAQSGDVLRLLLGQGTQLALVGTAIGLACAGALVRLLNSTLPSVPGSDPLAVAGLAVLLNAITLLACWLPSRRATKIDPVIALRSE
jgi:putative ABC transport system permease protein